MVRSVFRAEDGTSMVIREPRRGDAPALLRFINDLAVEPMSGILVDGKLTLKDEEEYVTRLLAEIKGKTTATLFVESDGRIVGNCSISRLRWKMRHRAVLAIALSKDVREKGVGTELARMTMSLAIERLKGIEVIELSYLAYNKRAQSFYTKLGFRPEDIVRDSVKEADQYFDEQRMVLRLGRSERKGGPLRP
jgi:RimJ/RimL family protein N-acetyltransferase